MPDQSTESLATTLARLKAERDAADARYNEALTTLDRSLVAPAALPRLSLALDDHQMATLNDAWNTLPAPPEAAGLRGRLTRFVWRIVGPYLQRQLTFNSLVVDHINRNAAAARASHHAAAALVDALQAHVAASAGFQSRLMLYLQEITGYVDTKDRDTAGGALVVNRSIGGLAESSARQWESLSARALRLDARAEALEAAQEDLRSMIAVSHQAGLSLKRELEKLLQQQPSVAAGTVPDASGTPGSDLPAADKTPTAQFAPLDAYKYVGFEDRFRGSQAVIRQRLESYLRFFEGTTDILDIGCGRGEFLDLLGARGIQARGIDLNHEMAEGCRARGLEVAEADAVGYLARLPEGSLGGIFAAQVVEHLQPAYLLRLLDLSFHALRPGGHLVLETLNPACWVAFFESYIRDITHVWPLHPETLKYLVMTSGFTKVEIEFRSPVPSEDRLQMVAVAGADRALGDLAEAFNANVEKLNARIFTFMDYAVVAER